MKRIQFKSIQNRMIFLFMLIIVIPMGMMSSYFYSSVEHTTKIMISESNENAIEQMTLNLKSGFQEIIDVSNVLTGDKKIVEALATESKNGARQDFFISKEIGESIYTTMNSILKSEAYITIIGLKGSIYSNLSDNYEYYKFYSKMQWYKDVLKENGRIRWINANDKMILDASNNKDYFFTMARTIKDRNGLRDYGVLLISLNIKHIEDVLKKYANYNEGFLYLIDKSGTIIVNKDRSMIGKRIPELLENKEILTNDGTFEINSKGKNLLVNCQSININEWKLIQMLPHDKLYGNIQRIRNENIAIIVLLLGAFVVVIIYSVTKVTKPIKKLRKKMEEVQNGNLNVNVDVAIERGDEIGDLSRCFNTMMSTIRRLIIERDEEHVLREEARLEALQAQINPHFLFNTLNSIKWAAIISKAENVAKAIGALGKLLETSINRGNDIISVKEEIDCLKNYILIHKIRYVEDFSIEYLIQEEALELFTIKLILQPLVENSILHGFENKEGVRRIEIHVKIEDKILVMEVVDDGNGIPSERIDELLKKEQKSKQVRFNGIGLKNVDERIKLNFGKQYGIKIYSVEGIGTKIRVEMPAMNEGRHFVNVQDNYS